MHMDKKKYGKACAEMLYLMSPGAHIDAGMTELQQQLKAVPAYILQMLRETADPDYKPSFYIAMDTGFSDEMTTLLIALTDEYIFENRGDVSYFEGGDYSEYVEESRKLRREMRKYASVGIVERRLQCYRELAEGEAAE